MTDWLVPRARVVLPSGIQLTVGVADTPEARGRGLMFRETLGDVDGLLFVFDEDDHHTFWMQNTPLALDIAWLDATARVVTIARDAQPCRLPPCRRFRPALPARYVLEVAAGRLQSEGVREGDQLSLRF
jgi:uncharacterized membrane protein (UPF0127 family)